ncbi:aminodeoxychorismate lyase [Alteribacillus sp. HJP-4]|uniref:aminodeoxychorismate lyase n=1 Tax=Alteribacillus sp. HJP-4 TaxID=2775394 RepID=UPI0035CD2C89
MYVNINGEIKKAGDARLSVFEHGFMYGLGLFETFRIYEGHPFLLDDHFRRLESGLEELNIMWSYDRGLVLKELRELMRANGWTNAYVRYNVSAGPGELGLTVEKYTQPTVIIYMKPLPEPAGREAVKKARLLQVKRNTPETNVRLKSHHYLNSIMGKREIGADPDTEGLFLTSGGFLAEGVVSNLFWVKNKTLFTPSLDTGILPGITRALIIRLAVLQGWTVREGLFSPDALFDAEEAFVTNSIQEIVRLSSVDDKTWEGTMHDSAAAQLLKKYRQYRTKLFSMDEIEEKERENHNE